MHSPQRYSQTTPDSSAGAATGPDLDLLFDRFDLVYLVRTYWKRLLVVPLLCALLAGAIHFTREPVYESSALLLVDSSVDQLLDFERPENAANSAQESLKSLEVAVVADSVMLRVIERLGLREAPGFLPESLTEEGDVPDAKLLHFLRENRIEATLQPETRLIRLAVTDPDPERARRIASAFVEEFEAFLADQRKDEATEVKSSVKGQIAEARREALAAEATLTEFRKKNAEIPMEQDHDLFATRLSQLGEDLNAAVRNRVETASVRESISDLEPEEKPIEIIEVGGYRDVGHISDMLTALASSRSRLAAAEEQYTENHPTRQSAAAEVERNREQVIELAHDIKSTIDTRYEAAVKREQYLEKEVEALQAKLVEVKEKGSEFRALKEEAENSWTLYQSLQQRLADSIMSADMPGSVATVVSEPLTPYSESGPPLFLFVVIGGVAGCILSGGWLFWQLLQGLPFSDSRQLEERLGAPVIADWTSSGTRRNDRNQESSWMHFVAGASGESVQVLTPGLNGVGGTIVERMARASAMAGRKTLLVTIGEGSRQAEIRETSAPKLDRLDLGPGDVTNGSHLPAVMPRLRERYDLIFMDAGERDDLSVASRISALADRDVVVIGRGSGDKSEIANQVRRLGPERSGDIGFIMIDPSREKGKGDPKKSRFAWRKARRPLAPAGA